MLKFRMLCLDVYPWIRVMVICRILIKCGVCESIPSYGDYNLIIFGIIIKFKFNNLWSILCEIIQCQTNMKVWVYITFP